MPIDPEELASQFAEEGQQAQALQGALRGSVGVDPEKYVKAMALAAKNGATAPTVMRNQEHFQTQAEVDAIDPQGLQEISPKLAAWLVAHEDNAPVAKDDIPTLQKLEGSARDRARKAMELGIAEANKQQAGQWFMGPNWLKALSLKYPEIQQANDMYAGLGAGAVGGLGNLLSTVSDNESAVVQATVGRLAGTKASAQALDVMRSSNPVSMLFRGLDLVGKPISGWAQKHSYTTENLMMKDPVTGEEFINLNAANPAGFQGQMNAAKIVAGELAPTAATIALSLLTGGAGAVGAAPKVGRLLGLVKKIGQYAASAPGLLEMARTVQGQYQNGVQFLMEKDPTLNQEDAEVKAAPGALLAGLLSGPTGAAMEGKIYDDLLHKVSKAGGGSLVKKWGAKLLSLATTGIKEGAQEVMQGFAEDLADWITINPDKTLIQVAGNAIQNLTGGVAMGVGMHLAIPGAHGPEKPVSNIQDLVDATKESKLLQRSPEKFREAAGNLLGDEKVLIEPEPFIEYFQSKGLDPYAMAEKVGVKNLDEALASGNPLIMDTADYLTHLAVEHHEGLAPDLRTSIGEWTPRMSEENAAALDQAQAEMVQAQKALETINEPTLQEQIKADLVKKLDPLFEPSTAATYADAFASILANLEIRSGQDLSKWREGLTVSRPMEGERGMSTADVVMNRLAGVGKTDPMRGDENGPILYKGGSNAETIGHGTGGGISTESVSETPASRAERQARVSNPENAGSNYGAVPGSFNGLEPVTEITLKNGIPAQVFIEGNNIMIVARDGGDSAFITGSVVGNDVHWGELGQVPGSEIKGKNIGQTLIQELVLQAEKINPSIQNGELLAIAGGTRDNPHAVKKIVNRYGSTVWGDGDSVSILNREIIGPRKEVAQTLYQDDRQRRARQAMGRTLSPSGQGAELNRRADEARMSEASFQAWEAEVKAIQLGDVHEGKQGFIQFGPDYQVHVGLLESANLSTLIHEIAGHFAFEVMGDLAKQEGTPQQIKDDYARILEAVGAENGVVGKDQHEEFARLTEAYFMEGKAPSEELRGTFARVKEWMKLIYRQIKNLGVKLSPEVREIFDRMYASDEAISRARESAQETRKLIAKPEDVGWDQATFDRYQKTIAKGQERAAVEVEQKLIAEAQRQHESWWKDEEGKTQGEVEIAVDSRKDYKDLKALQRGQLEGGTPMKLDRAQIVALIGEKETQAISRSKGAVYVREGGVDIESAAEIMGYKSGRELVETLAGMPKRADLIERLTQEIMTAKHGDMKTDGTLVDVAAEAIHNKAREEQLAMELQAFAAKAKEVAPILGLQRKNLQKEQRQNLQDVAALSREQIGNMKDEQRQQSRDRSELENAQRQMQRADRKARMDVPPIATFRAAAVEIISSKKIMDINPDRYLQTGRQEGRKAFKAMGKQDFQAATQAKKNELMNHFLYLEAVKARALAEKQAGKARDLAKTPAQQRIGKAQGDYLNQMNSILDQYEFAKIPIRDLISRQTNREDWVKQQLEANGGEGTGILEPDPILYNEIPKNYKELTPAELGAVMDMLNNIQAVARNQYRYMLGDQEADFEAEKAEAISVARTVNDTTPIKASSAYEGGWDRTTRKLRGADAEMQKMEWWIDQLDGGDINGPWRRNIKKRIDDATAAKHALMKETYALIRKAFEARPKSERQAEMSESSGIQFPNRNGELSRLELITFWANMGNVENEHVAIEGEGLDNVEGIATLEAARKAMRPGEWKFVQEVWDSLETLKAGLFATEKAMTGLEPIAKTLTPFDVKMEDGSVIHMKGGYFPLRADPILDPKGEVMEDPFKHLAVGSMKASTKTGSAQKVTGATYPLLLDYRHILGPHLDSVITRITLGEAVRDVSRFIEDPKIKRTIQETLNVETEKEFRPWLQDLGNVQAADDGAITRFLMKRRSAMVVANLIGNVGSLLVQGGDLPRPAMEILNWNPVKLFGVRGYAKAYFDIVSNRKEMVALIKEMSPNEMRFRADYFQRDLREMKEARGAFSEANARVTEFLGKGFMVMDSIITFPAWLAKFRMGMDAHGDQAQAIMEADRLISRRVQAGEGRNMSHLFRRPGVAKLLTAFMGDSNTSYGIVSSAVKSKNVGRVLSAFMAIVFSNMIGKILKNRGPGDDDDWLPWVGDTTADAVFGMVPGVGDLEKLGMDKWRGKRAELRNPIAQAIVKPFELLKWTAENKEMDAEEFASDLMDAAGSWVGIPGTLQILRTWKYIRQVDEGKQNPDNAFKAGWDATLGPNPRKK